MDTTITENQLCSFEQRFARELDAMSETERTDVAIRMVYRAIELARKLAAENAFLREKAAA